MFRMLAVSVALAAALLCPRTFAATPDRPAPAPAGLECASPEAKAATNAEAAAPAAGAPKLAAAASAPRVVFQLNKAEEAPTILRFVTNYLAVEPLAKVAVVGYAGGIDFMLKGAKDADGKLYAEQMAALTARGVDFKVCNNTLRARSLTADAVDPLATVVPGAVNEIIRLQTREGYAHFQN